MHLALRVNGLDPTRIVCPTEFVIAGFLLRPDRGSMALSAGSAAVRLAPANRSKPKSSSGPNASYHGVLGSSGTRVTSAPGVPLSIESSSMSRMSVG